MHDIAQMAINARNLSFWNDIQIATQIDQAPNLNDITSLLTPSPYKSGPESDSTDHIEYPYDIAAQDSQAANLKRCFLSVDFNRFQSEFRAY